LALGMKISCFQGAPKNSHTEGILSESFHFQSDSCQQFSGEPHSTFSSFKATVDSTVTDFMLQ